MFKNKEIVEMQQGIKYDPDSSPAAWEHYMQVYQNNDYINKHYNLKEQFYYNDYRTVGLRSGYFNGSKEFNYVNKPSKYKDNRLYILEKGTEIIDNKYIESANRLGGECDFNFNNEKYDMFLKIIKDDPDASEKEKNIAIEQLSRCHKNHHTLINFSLMQAIGNMQTAKGRNRFDRFDTFIYELNNYYQGLSDEILQSSSANNKQALKEFLDSFKNVYDYCKTFYFIDKNLVDEMIKSGSKPISNTIEIVRYMDLAEKYSSTKEYTFLQKEFLTIQDYFLDGGVVLSKQELSKKLENDLGLNQEDIDELIAKCEERGFITSIGNNNYTR